MELRYSLKSISIIFLLNKLRIKHGLNILTVFMAHTKPRQRLDSNSAGNRKEERFSSSLHRPGKWMWPQRKRDSARLNFSKTVLECPAETNRPGILAESDAFKIVRRSGNTSCRAHS